MDRITKQRRSKLMSRIKSKNTSPEIKLRRYLRSQGLRYRLHDRSVPGTPDISNKSKKIAIFVDGCFWHGCPRCYVMPKSNETYWINKMQYNKNRRIAVKRILQRNKWNVVEIWEHEIMRSSNILHRKLSKFFMMKDL